MSAKLFFKLYGTLTLELFARGEEAPPTLSSTNEEDPHDSFQHVNTAKLKEQLAKILSANDRSRIDKIVKSFREKLETEQHEKLPRGAEQSLNEKLKQFRDHLEIGQESGLEHNSFHELTKLLFHSAIRGAFTFLHLETRMGLPPPPPPMPFSPTLREIWLRPKEFGGFFNKMAHTFSKWINLGRIPVALILFVGSSFTTYRGVNDLLQSPDTGPFLQHMFEGSEGEALRYFISILIGVVLSSAILDYKARLFQGMAETGSVLTGIRNSFRINPRWMVLATLLTTVSIKTNYDGIVSIFSKKEDLGAQSEVIKNVIQKALGDPYLSNAEDPNSLYDLQATLLANVRSLATMLERIPDDELEGIASSGDPRKGPRYWAKHFIVFGGYEPGISDVNLSYNTPFSNSIDQMMSETGIDFFSGFNQKAGALQSTYENHMTTTRANIDAHLALLDQMMRIKGYSLEEIKRLLSVEHYQINNIVALIVEDLEKAKDVYQYVVEDLGDLTKIYLEILLKVDRSGNIQPGDYVLTASMNVPRIDAIDQLRAGMIPKAKHKSFSELRFFLMEKYGSAAGATFLALVLFFSISMDMGDPILFSRSIARHGRRDRDAVHILFNDLVLWEKKCTQRASSLLGSSEVQNVFGNQFGFSMNVVELHFHRYLEVLNRETKHPLDRHVAEAFFLWFVSMFRLNRPLWIQGYNTRVHTLDTLYRADKPYMMQWFQGFFFPVSVIRKISSHNLTDTYALVVAGTEKTKDEINRIIRTCQDDEDMSNISKSHDASPQTVGIRPLARTRSSRLRHSLKKPLAFMELVFFRSLGKPQPSFPLSFRKWRQDFVLSLIRSSNLKNLITKLQPEMHVLIDQTIPAIFESGYYPIKEIQKNYASQLSDSWKERFQSFENRLFSFEQNLLESIGLLPILSAPSSSIDFLETLSGMESAMNLNTDQILNILKVVDNARDGGRSSIRQISAGLELKEESDELLALAQRDIAMILEEEKRQKALLEMQREQDRREKATAMNRQLMDLRNIFNEINQIILKVKMQEVDFRKKGFPSQTVMLNHHLNQSMIVHAPKEADAILRVMEAILVSENPYTEANFNTLEELRQQALDLQDRLVAFLEYKGGSGLEEKTSAALPVGQKDATGQPQITTEGRVSKANPWPSLRASTPMGEKIH